MALSTSGGVESRSSSMSRTKMKEKAPKDTNKAKTTRHGIAFTSPLMNVFNMHFAQNIMDQEKHKAEVVCKTSFVRPKGSRASMSSGRFTVLLSRKMG